MRFVLLYKKTKKSQHKMAVYILKILNIFKFANRYMIYLLVK